MKKRISLCFAFLALILLPAFNLSADPGDDPIPIKIEESQSDPNDPNRGPTQLPITCYYYSSFDSVFAVFQYSLGTVTVEIENQTTGFYSCQIINGLAGAHLIPASSDAGTYCITFTLANGSVYSGYYVLL